MYVYIYICMCIYIYNIEASQVALVEKNLLVNAGGIRDMGLIRKIPWRREQQPTPIFLAGESPWTEEPRRLQSIGSQGVRH